MSSNLKQSSQAKTLLNRISPLLKIVHYQYNKTQALNLAFSVQIHATPALILANLHVLLVVMTYLRALIQFYFVQKCSKNEFLNENFECVKCQIYGCVKCDANQICDQCDQNFKLDKANNQCVLMNKVCPILTNFLLGPSQLKQCNNECLLSFYQNMEAQILTVKCIQIEESQKLYFSQRIIQIKPINEDQYLVVGNACTFALLDNNWKVINIQILQNITDYDQIHTYDGDEITKESFVIGNQVGCLAALLRKKSKISTENSFTHTTQFTPLIFM
ncbi:transmembrane protein, putative (macronuclear) [Tetrahymena thermophila SB210]|uniref:Transmembrane protein, putative n=1 Tax=Tetrahymena thermophila (strain SB210) TaxID=312017 RepID=Q23H57_TETTS|nr:transmembrane protein, putative [Tetrahymena thermophila SB210]EAR95869.1 transmembrane protein, putative [Tetrahymena thermophila SB210]|eukprot:XP_001016114.1 transmembrane protein, putative [Tetrahymena thermophila SB210]